MRPAGGRLDGVEPSLFDDVGDAVRGLVPPELGDAYLRAHRYGIKLWFRTAKPGREHYEAQVVGTRDVPAARMLALEVGFHAEHPKEAENDAVIARLEAVRRRWQREIGGEAEAAPFLGQHGALAPDLGGLARSGSERARARVRDQRPASSTTSPRSNRSARPEPRPGRLGCQRPRRRTYAADWLCARATRSGAGPGRPERGGTSRRRRDRCGR